MNAQSQPPIRPHTTALGAVPPALHSATLDRPTRRMAIGMTLCFWFANISVQMLRSMLDGHDDLAGLFAARCLMAAGGILICFAIHLIITHLSHRAFSTRAIVLAVIMPFAADACAWMSYLSTVAFAPHSAGGGATSSTVIQAVLYWFWFLLAWAALYLALRYSYEVKVAERRARVIEGLAHTAQLQALQNQISPHFMFNTLNSISALMLEEEVEPAEAMVRRLSHFLRATLKLDALSDISLAEELRIQRMYLDIEQARFPDMTVTVDCPAELAEALVPALITQPIVENAVKYGVASSLEPTNITIAASREADELVLKITDDARASIAFEGGLGVGLRNVADRLQNRFGAAHRFAAGPLEGGGFEVLLSLPFGKTRL